MLAPCSSMLGEVGSASLFAGWHQVMLPGVNVLSLTAVCAAASILAP